MKTRLLYLCTGNSCRSQMAEGWTRHLWPDLFETFSAGIVAHGVNPHAITVMAEKGIDISGHRSKSLAELDSREFDVVITVCGHADEACPIFPAKTLKIHKGFDDPPRLASNAKNPEEALEHFRRVRDEIAEYVKTLPNILHR
ncbi:MAG: arsenate reductase ArsC [Candidatus Ozemobacteraceae bacterium]